MSKKEKYRITVSILDTQYQIVTDDDPNRVNDIAQYVDSLIREVKQSSPYMSQLSAAILAMLNLSDELFKLRSEVGKYKENEDDYQALVNYKSRLSEAMSEIEKNESRVKILETRLEGMELENRELTTLIEEYRQKFNNLRSEFDQNKRALAEMQNKLIENQLELVKARKSYVEQEEG